MEAARGGNSLPTFHDFMDEGLRARISEAVAKIGGSKAAGGIVGVSDEAIGRWRKGPVKPPFPGVVALCRAANFRVEWMATGVGPRDIQPEGDLSQGGTQQEHRSADMVQVQQAGGVPQGMVLLPRLNIEASAGQGIVPADEDIVEFLAFKADFLRHLGVDPRNAHVLQIKGGSMYPTLRDRDVIIIDASLVDVLVEGVYTLVYDGAVLAKRLQPLRDGSIVISSDNKDEGWRDEIVPPSERHTLKIVGRVRGLYRNF